MRILYLTNNENTENLYQWLKKQEEVYLCTERVDRAIIDRIKPQMLISYNYNYLISQEIIGLMKKNVINLHISLLPWNRGVSPNIWSFIDNTPKGVTIHYINKELDRGNIIIQKELFFDIYKETFKTTYNKLNKEIQKLFRENWIPIKNGQLTSEKQKGEGSYHSLKDLKELQQEVSFSWNDNIEEFLKKYKSLKRDRE